MQKNYYISSFLWSSAGTLTSAIVNFISIPILLKYFGVDNYGILTLAIATNAYMALLNLGVNTGGVKFFSAWLSQGEMDKLDKVARTSISFYGIIGVINALILIILALFGRHWFNVSEELFPQLQTAFIIMACFAVFNWASFVFTQLLIADHKIAYTHRVYIVRNFFDMALVFAAIWFKLSLSQYFFFYIMIHSFVFIPFFITCRYKGLIKSIVPQFYWNDFKPIIIYSLSIFAMGLFQATATKSRPIILGIVAQDAPKVLAEYRIVEVFPVFIVSLCGVLTSIFLPQSSRFIAQNDTASIERLAYAGTKYTAMLTCLLCVPIMLNAHELLTVYVGADFDYLSKWIVLWVVTLLMALHNTPVSSLVIASGKTRALVWSSALACVVSICINVVTCKYFEVGSAVVGYFVYIIIQLLFHYLYFNNKVLHLDSFRIFKSFIIPTSIGVAAYFMVHLADRFDWSEFSKAGVILYGVAKAAVWLAVYLALMMLTGVLKKSEILSFIPRKTSAE